MKRRMPWTVYVDENEAEKSSGSGGRGRGGDGGRERGGWLGGRGGVKERIRYSSSMLFYVHRDHKDY